MSASKHRGSSFDEVLEDEGILDDVSEIAAERVIAWQLRERMRAKHVSRAELARRMRTSRSQVDRMLQGTEPGIGLGTLIRAARALDSELRVELV